MQPAIQPALDTTEYDDFSGHGGDNEHEACVTLWAATMKRAKDDLTAKNRTARESATYWFLKAEGEGVGSLPWMCSLFNLDIEAVRERVRKIILKNVFAKVKPAKEPDRRGTCIFPGCAGKTKGRYCQMHSKLIAARKLRAFNAGTAATVEYLHRPVQAWKGARG